ncbi:MFS transporter [Ginsengibacter hankyongi]|uniref:MFS transporter n=1 Tax=Ginsengibacter hankyongi TaxID=2607284 RepID=A0A5J5IIV8_9BACT|nr:MFS transporter [Ginsengibacter hankyongi]KAA9040876.1 MFS transporter [Ginsengibacter hankyongi]
MNKKHIAVFSIPVIVAALGYFVDIYDLLLFNIVRIPSLKSLGLSATDIDKKGELIIGIQMIGLLIGGIIWGIAGDKKGRLSILFGSIILYSLANIANGFVQTVPQYIMARFVAGIGLAGELGGGITLVAELLKKEQRGIGTAMVAGIGLTGAIVAFFISQKYDWRICYFIGGGLGFLLLLMRVSVFESGMYQAMERTVSKGNFLMFFNNKKRFKKYACSILLGLPTWYVIGILIAFSNKFAKQFGMTDDINPGKATMYAYIAISVGDVIAGLLSQLLKSRKKALYIFYVLTIIMIALYFMQTGSSTASSMYWIAAGLGFATGFWAIFVTMGAEQFGTNLRATAATTVPNMVRGSLPLMLLLFNGLQGYFSYTLSGLITGIVVMIISIIATLLTEETFHKELDYIEM